MAQNTLSDLTNELVVNFVVVGQKIYCLLVDATIF